MSEHTAYRDAVTGEYVTPEYAAEHPDTTVGETVEDEGSDEASEQDAEQ